MSIDLEHDWYTDLVDIYRETSYKLNGFTKQAYILMQSKVICRIFRNSQNRTQMTNTASETLPKDMLAVSVNVDIKPGDRLLVTRGGRLGSGQKPSVYYAGDPAIYYEPFGQVMPKLRHQEIPLGATRRITEGA